MLALFSPHNRLIDPCVHISAGDTLVAWSDLYRIRRNCIANSALLAHRCLCGNAHRGPILSYLVGKLFLIIITC